jgi:hypothetical protein
MNPTFWARVARSNRIIHLIDGMQIQNQWRGNCFVLMKINRLLPKEDRIRINDTTAWGQLEIQQAMIQVSLKLKAIANKHNCDVHVEQFNVYVGLKSHMEHMYKLRSIPFEYPY